MDAPIPKNIFSLNKKPLEKLPKKKNSIRVYVRVKICKT